MSLVTAGPVGPFNYRGGQSVPQGPVGNTFQPIYQPYGTNAPTGSTGPQGPVGPLGPTGAVGFQGPQGQAGSVGVTGATGPAGPQWALNTTAVLIGTTGNLTNGAFLDIPMTGLNSGWYMVLVYNVAIPTSMLSTLFLMTSPSASNPCLGAQSLYINSQNYFIVSQTPGTNSAGYGNIRVTNYSQVANVNYNYSVFNLTHA